MGRKANPFYSMPKAAKSKSGSARAQPYEAEGNSLFESKPRVFRLGHDLQGVKDKLDLTRFVKWPRYVRLQRSKRVLVSRLKSPPAIAQFGKTLDSSTTNQLFNLAKNYKPEDKAAKKERLTKAAADRKAAGDANKKAASGGKAPNVVKFGLNHVTDLVESKKASLVAIASDVEPIELVVWLPALCKKMDVPYCIVKGRGRLGQAVGKKSSAVMAFTNVDKADEKALKDIAGVCMESFNNDDKVRRTWGGGLLGRKSQLKKEAKEAALAKEAAKKLAAQ